MNINFPMIDNDVGRTNFCRLARFYIQQQIYGERDSDGFSWIGAVAFIEKIREISSLLAKDTSSRPSVGRRIRQYNQVKNLIKKAVGTDRPLIYRPREETMAMWDFGWGWLGYQNDWISKRLIWIMKILCAWKI